MIENYILSKSLCNAELISRKIYQIRAPWGMHAEIFFNLPLPTFHCLHNVYCIISLQFLLYIFFMAKLILFLFQTTFSQIIYYTMFCPPSSDIKVSCKISIYCLSRSRIKFHFYCNTKTQWH